MLNFTKENKEEIFRNIVQKQVEELNNTVNTLKNELKKEVNTIQNIETNNQGIINNNQIIVNNIQNIQNIQNIETQNIQNITINLLPFLETVIQNEDILNPFLKENSAAYEYAKMPYLDKSDVTKNDANNQLISSALVEMIDNIYSESGNRNIYLLKKDKVMVYQKDGIWCVKSLDSASRELCGNVIQKCKKMRDKITYPKETCEGDKLSIKETLMSLPIEYENNTSKILKNAKPELSILFESNKDKLKNDKLI